MDIYTYNAYDDAAKLITILQLQVNYFKGSQRHKKNAGTDGPERKRNPGLLDC